MKERILKKLETKIQIVNLYKELSVSQTTKVGCIIFKKDFTKIAAIGYNGRYPGCKINNHTHGEETSLEPGKSDFVHAEVNATIKFNEPMSEISEYIVLCTLSPCVMCSQVLVNKGFKYIFWLEEYRDTSHVDEIFSKNCIEYGGKKQLFNFYSK